MEFWQLRLQCRTSPCTTTCSQPWSINDYRRACHHKLSWLFHALAVFFHFSLCLPSSADLFGLMYNEARWPTSTTLPDGLGSVCLLFLEQATCTHKILGQQKVLKKKNWEGKGGLRLKNAMPLYSFVSSIRLVNDWSNFCLASDFGHHPVSYLALIFPDRLQSRKHILGYTSVSAWSHQTPS